MAHVGYVGQVGKVDQFDQISQHIHDDLIQIYVDVQVMIWSDIKYWIGLLQIDLDF